MIKDMICGFRDKFQRLKGTPCNIIFSSIIALLVCFLIYPFLYSICTYHNLNDFYVGSSIYENHNKYLDIGMLFIYLFIYSILSLFIKTKNYKNLPAIQHLTSALSQINFTKFTHLKKYLNLLLTIIISVSVIYLLFTSHGIHMLDTHHYGEKFAVYYAHIKYGMKYYSDIMLVHGFMDVLPAWFADNILGDLTFIKERIAGKIITILFCISNLVMAFLIFRKDLVLGLLSSGILIFLLHIKAGTVHTVFFALCYLILLHFYKKNTIFWYTFFYITSCIMLLYQTTCGTVCFAASLPLFVRKFRDNPKAGVLFLVLAGIITYFVFGELIAAYLSKAGYYISSNLYAFGNDFPVKIKFYRFIIAIFGFLSIPFFINTALTSENREIRYLSLYAIILPIGISNYALGRIDSSYVTRSMWLSSIIITVILPYLAYITNKNKYLLKVILCLIFISFTVLKKDSPSSVIYEDLAVMDYVRSLPGETYLDLTNRGMNYYYSSKKPAIPYTSFYNIVNTKQTNELLENFKQNPPSVVLLYTKEGIIAHDNVRPPQRINAVYRWLFTSGNYKKEEFPFGSFLVYSPGDNPQDPLRSDCYFSASDIQYLPDVWGASVNTLPMKKVHENLPLDGNIIITDCTPKEADLLYIEYTAQDKNTAFSMTVNDIPSALQFRSKKNKLLIPLDNYPSWLCADRLEFVTLQADKNFKIQKAELYKRN